MQGVRTQLLEKSWETNMRSFPVISLLTLAGLSLAFLLAGDSIAGPVPDNDVDAIIDLIDNCTEH